MSSLNAARGKGHGPAIMHASDTLDTLPELCAALRNGACVVLIAPQPVLMAKARGIDAATINLMAREARGLVCHAMTAVRMLDIGVPLIPSDGQLPDAWRFAVSYEAATGCSTGISAHDRARTMNAGATERVLPGDIATPGHIIPVLGDPNSPHALTHAPSAALRVLQMADVAGGAAICTILDVEGAVADTDGALALARRLGLHAVCVADLSGELPRSHEGGGRDG